MSTVYPIGNVKIYKGTKLLKTKALSGGKVTITLPKLTRARVTVTGVASSGRVCGLASSAVFLPSTYQVSLPGSQSSPAAGNARSTRRAAAPGCASVPRPNLYAWDAA